MSFLLNVLEFPDVLEGKIFTTLIEENPSLFKCLKLSPNRRQNLLEYISDVLVNGPVTLVPFLKEGGVKPKIKIKPPGKTYFVLIKLISIIIFCSKSVALL